MSEIVRIKSSGTIGVVRATYINAATGEELVEVQPVGRTHRNVFLRRVDVERATQGDLSCEIARVALLMLSEIEKSVADVAMIWPLADLRDARALFEAYARDAQ